MKNPCYMSIKGGVGEQHLQARSSEDGQFMVLLTRSRQWTRCIRCMQEAKCILLHATTLVSSQSGIIASSVLFCKSSCQLAVRWQLLVKAGPLSVAHPFSSAVDHGSVCCCKPARPPAAAVPVVSCCQTNSIHVLTLRDLDK